MADDMKDRHRDPEGKLLPKDPTEREKLVIIRKLVEMAIWIAHGAGTYDVNISRVERSARSNEIKRYISRLRIDLRDLTLLQQFELAEHMMLFWGERAKKLQEAMTGDVRP